MPKQTKPTMNTKKAVWAGLIAGCVVACANVLIMTAVKPSSAEMAAMKFCRAQVADSDWRMKMIVTEDLKNQWRAAEKQSDAIQRARPDEKPPLGDGVQVSSFPAHRPECSVGQITKRGDNQVANINYIDPANPSSNWTDRVIVKQEGTAFLIDDVIFPSNGGNLRTALNRAIKTPVPEAEIAADEPVARAEPAAGNTAPQQPVQPATPQREQIIWNTNN